MLRSLSLPILALFLTALPAVAQTTDSNARPPASQPPNSTASSDAKKPKKVWTNEDISKSTNGVSVVGDAKDKDKPKPVAPRTANAQYVASIRKQLEKLQKQLEDVDKQITDLKNFNAGEPSTTARDRKSTRLNSSHVEISYAVFCLKKKKKEVSRNTRLCAR